MIDSVLQQLGEHNAQRRCHCRGQATTIALHHKLNRTILGLQSFFGEAQQWTHDLDERNIVARFA